MPVDPAPHADDPRESGAQATIGEFNRRVDAAQMAATPTKGWVRDAVRRRGSSRCPVRLRRLSLDVVLRHGAALADLFVAYPDDIVHVQPYDMFVGYQPSASAALDPVRLLTEAAAWTDEWGTAWEHAAGGSGASPHGYPIGDWADLDRYLESSLPDPRAPGRFGGAIPTVRALGPTHYMAGTTHQAIWERFHQLRGMEGAFEDLYLNPAETSRLLDVLTDYQIDLVRQWAGLGNVDAVFLTDDWGSQAGMLIAPAKWQEVFAPRYRRICDEAHRHDLDVIFHSCGNIASIIGPMIDAGIDVIDPLQSEALDLAWLAREYGGKVAFAGGLPEQTLAHLTPAGVRDEVHRTIDLLGPAFGNALILAPSNSILADVPLENLVALFEAAHQQ